MRVFRGLPSAASVQKNQKNPFYGSTFVPFADGVLLAVQEQYTVLTAER